MTAIRITDDHLELANIGTATHAQIDTHIGNASAHHVKTTDASEIVSGIFDAARIPDSFATDFEVNDAIYVHKSLSDAHHAKTTDASEITSGQFDDARIPAAIARDAEVTDAIATHAGLPAAHHIRYGDSEAVDAIEAEAELDLKLFNSVTQPHAWVYNSAAQTIPNATTTTLTWSAAVFNIGPNGDLLWSAGTNPSRLTVKYPGLYLIHARARFDVNGTGIRLGFFYKNGGTLLAMVEVTPTANVKPSVTVTNVVALALDDYIEVKVQQSSGGNLNVLGTEAYTSFMAARLY